MNARFVLIHSPLCGPLTWMPVADELRRRGIAALMPPLRDSPEAGQPYWQQHAASVAVALAAVPADLPLVLVGHSGAGPLLPVIRERLVQRVGGYIFADAGLPHPGRSRFDEWAVNSPDLAPQLREHLAAGGRYPTWGDDDLHTVIPDERRRADVIAELHPRPLAFFDEIFPDSPGWPDAPCAYLRFTASYDRPAREARARGWPVRALNAGHFHQLVEPATVAEALLSLTGQIGQ
jgi:hypothetical protein